MNDALDHYSRLLERLEEIARRILEGRLLSVQDMWQFEIDLAKFQREQQRAMQTEKKQRKAINSLLQEVCRTKIEGWEVQRQQYQNELQQIDARFNVYSYAFDIARRIGDALVWIFLDRSQITFRSRDASMPSSTVHRVPEGHGFYGMLAVGEALYKAGAGLPILHDITSSLRIGDITFYNPQSDPLTIEVKTRLKERRGDHMVLEVEVYNVSSSSDVTKWDAIYAHLPPEIEVSQNMSEHEQAMQESQAMEEGLKRQIERMTEIAVRQTAQEGELLRLGKRKAAIVQHLNSEQNMHHYDILQELIHEAKTQGFAWRTVDDAFIYTAVYQDTPTWLHEGEELIPKDRVEDYQRAYVAIALPEKEQNFIGIYDAFDSIPFVRPFFLYPLPADIVVDVMWKRLQIIVTVNLGKLVEALKAVGVNARLPRNKQEVDDLFLPVSAEIPLPDGRTAYGSLKGLYYYGAQLTHEFLSLEAFVNLISFMIETASEQVKKEGVYDSFLPRQSDSIESS